MNNEENILIVANLEEESMTTVNDDKRLIDVLTYIDENKDFAYFKIVIINKNNKIHPYLLEYLESINKSNIATTYITMDDYLNSTLNSTTVSNVKIINFTN